MGPLIAIFLLASIEMELWEGARSPDTVHVMVATPSHWTDQSIDSETLLTDPFQYRWTLVLGYK